MSETISQFQDFDPDDNLLNGSVGFGLESCKSYTLDEYYSSDHAKFDLSLLNFNIRSFHSNRRNFETMLASFQSKFSLIVLTETWNTESNLNLCFIDGYNSAHTFRPNLMRGGGVSVFSIEPLGLNKISHLCLCTDSIETCVVRTQMNNLSFIIIAVYRPPNGSISSFLGELEIILMDQNLRGKILILAGDVNIDLSETNTSDTSNYMNLISSMHFFPVINEITRLSTNDNGNVSASILDHILVNRMVPCSSGVLLQDISDHYPAFAHFQFKIKNTNKENLKIVFRPYKESNQNNFIHGLHRVDWDSLLADSDINEAYGGFVREISKLYCETFPLKTKYISENRKNKPWLTGNIIKLLRRKSNYCKMLNTGLISKETNNRFKNFVTSEIRKAENSYYMHSFQSFRNNTRSSWRAIKYLIGSGNSAQKNPLVPENSSDEDATQRVESFSQFFSSVGSLLDSSLPPINSPTPLVDDRNLNSFFFHPVGESELEKIILDLKSGGAGLDEMPVKLFKNVRKVLLRPICKLINLSFETGSFPDLLKIARITPIHKQGNLTDPSNFRPISCLPYLSKIFEKCAKNRLISFCEKFSIISTSQFGFQRHKSTSDALINLTEIIYDALNSRAHSLSLLIDLKKAFDTVNYDVLLRKLENFGVRGVPLDWFRSYLTDRKSFVQINSVKSSLKTTNIGVPQGSVLGPILFLLYINDVSNVSDGLVATLFADDTTLTVTDEDFSNLLSSTNTELTKLHDWTIQNRLTINVAKTELLIVTNRDTGAGEVLVRLGQGLVNRVESCKFLGVHLDHKLNFSSHINYICGKISKHAGILYRIRDNLPLNVRLNYYYGLIYPFLSYNVCVWGGTYASHLQPLIVQHKRLIRIITNSNYMDHTLPLFHRLNILKFEDIYKFNLLIQVHKFISKGLFVFKPDGITRSRYFIEPKFQRLSLTQHAFSYAGPSHWNLLPLEIRELDRLGTFKKKLKRYLLDKYVSVPL